MWNESSPKLSVFGKTQDMWHTEQYSVGHQDVFLKPIELGLSWGKIGQMGLHGKQNTSTTALFSQTLLDSRSI